MTLPFSNNLKKDDRVFDTGSKRQGRVPRDPQSEKQRMTPVIFDGRTSVQYVDVMQLRLVVDGRQIEDNPPIDGIPPELHSRTAAPAAAAPAKEPDAVTMLREVKGKIAAEISAIEKRFKELKAEEERIDKALAALTS